MFGAWVSARVWVRMGARVRGSVRVTERVAVDHYCDIPGGCR